MEMLCPTATSLCNSRLTTSTTTSASYIFHKVVQQLAYGKIILLMLPTTSLWKKYVRNVATQQPAYAILA